VLRSHLSICAYASHQGLIRGSKWLGHSFQEVTTMICRSFDYLDGDFLSLDQDINSINVIIIS
ncbi:MAG: hypothetical protein ACR2OU_03385, partial [Thermomicrobiales bacterium]